MLHDRIRNNILQKNERDEMAQQNGQFVAGCWNWKSIVFFSARINWTDYSSTPIQIFPMAEKLEKI